MRDFYTRHQYLIVWILGLVIIGSLATVILQMNSYIPPSQPTFPSQPQPIAASDLPPAAATPAVTITLEQTGKENGLLVQWQNLPTTTTALAIFRKLTGSTSTGQLVGIIQLSPDQSQSGNSLIDLGKSSQNGYSYYAQAWSDGGAEGGGNASSSASSSILWSSAPVVPLPPSEPTSSGQGSDNGGGSGETQASTSNATSSPQQNNNASTSEGPGNGGGNGAGSGGTASSTNNGGGSGPGSNGDVYYTPEIQGIGGSSNPGTFSVQHVDQSIEINWQGLSADTTDIVITRSESSTGPWNQILQEQNPSVNGSSSIELVDGTLGDPYYYEMTAFLGSTMIATYGPEYLPPAGE